jgi:hypothetical protein
MNRSFYLLFFILWLPYFGVAQAEPGIDTQFKQITYTGKIVDAETQEPLPFAQINHIYKFTDKDSLIVRNFIADKDGNIIFRSNGDGFETVNLTVQNITINGMTIQEMIKEYVDETILGGEW